MPEEQKTNAPQENAQQDILRTPEFEAKEMEKLINRGTQAHGTIGLLTVLGLLILGATGFYYQRYDVYRTGERTVHFPTHMGKLIENQVYKDRETYRTRGPSSVPQWPMDLYIKLRQDIFLLAGAAFLLSLIFTHISQAKSHRNDLLMYRGLAREIERLRKQVRQLRGEAAPPTQKDSEAPSGDIDNAPTDTETTEEA